MAAGGLGGEGAGVVKCLLGFVEGGFRNIDVVHYRRQHLRRVRLPQLRKGGAGGLEARADVHGAGEDLVYLVGCAHEHAAHVVELSGFVAKCLFSLS